MERPAVALVRLHILLISFNLIPLPRLGKSQYQGIEKTSFLFFLRKDPVQSKIGGREQVLVIFPALAYTTYFFEKPLRV